MYNFSTYFVAYYRNADSNHRPTVDRAYARPLRDLGLASHTHAVKCLPVFVPDSIDENCLGKTRKND